MLKSMTGFGRCRNVTDEYRVSIEMEVVNHRYLDLSIKMPKRFDYFEAPVRTLLREYIRKGKVDLFISYENCRSGNICLRYNRALAAEYMEYFYKMSDEFGIRGDVKVSALAKFPEMLTMEQMPDDKEYLWEVLLETLKKTAVRFVKSREIEGERLKKDLLGKLGYIEALVGFIEEHSPQILTEYRNRLENEVKGLLNSTTMEENCITAEVTIYTDKTCADEETMRLRSRIHDTRDEFLSGEGVGRKLGFTVQEMNRETNTILSKSTDLSISDKTVALKTEIKRVREQVQNIE